MKQSDISLYIHWPFCLKKCPYCDFNSHVSEKVDSKIWKESYLKELDFIAKHTDYTTVRSVFFGGGTPSLMDPELIADILQAVRMHWKLSEEAEITLEGNPTSIEAEKYADFYRAGINRASVGVQSFDDNELKFLGRQHSAIEARKALDKVASWFSNVSFDLIYALPGQSSEKWHKALAEALNYATPHLSLYQLTIEKGTPFYKLHREKEIILPDEDIQADMYQITSELTAKHGLQAYEVSNYALPGMESQHNLAYWRYQDYIGIGPGAHGRVHSSQPIMQIGANENIATMTIHNPEKWLKSVQENGHGFSSVNALSMEDSLTESVMMGMRTKEGLQNATLQHISGRNYQELFLPSVLENLQNAGLVSCHKTIIRTTEKGRLLLGQITFKLIDSMCLNQ